MRTCSAMPLSVHMLLANKKIRTKNQYRNDPNVRVSRMNAVLGQRVFSGKLVTASVP
jgi:hypothetical protein